MLSRRHLRIRVMQSLYSWYQSVDRNTETAMDNLFRGAERTYDLYLSLILLLPELADEETRYNADQPARYTRKEQPVLSPLSGNSFIQFLNTEQSFLDEVKRRKISWQQENEHIRKLFYSLRHTQEFRDYVSAPEHTVNEDVEFCTWIYKNIIITSEPLMNALEEKNIWWAEALELINSMVQKTIRVAHPDKKGHFELMPIFRDEQDDREFMERLFRETIRNDAYFEKLIAEKTKNWEVERIALMDVILLKMALVEILCFPGIPVKVSINEYIDISKDYSTPKSKVFINGVIDKLVADLKASGAVKKTGRGLIE